MEVILSQNARPIRDHDSMRRSCDRISGTPTAGAKKRETKSAFSSLAVTTSPRQSRPHCGSSSKHHGETPSFYGPARTQYLFMVWGVPFGHELLRCISVLRLCCSKPT